MFWSNVDTLARNVLVVDTYYGLGSEVVVYTLDKSGWHLYNGADRQSFALVIWRSFLQAKQKPLRSQTVGAFELEIFML